MSLQLYLGTSGSGKSNALYSRVIEEARMHEERRYLVLVPEQFTMQTQKRLVSMHPSNGILNIDILSFQRLAYRIFEETGKSQVSVIDEIGKTFIVKRAAQQIKDDLKALGKGLDKMGYVNEIKSLISELMQYDLTPQKLDLMIEANQKNHYLSQKLEDMKLILQAFHDYKREKYITSEEILDLLCRVIDESKWLRGVTIILDGYTGFTPVQKRLVSQLMRLSKDIWIAVTIDASQRILSYYPDYHLFHMSGAMINGILKMAKETNTKILPYVKMDAQHNLRFSNSPALAALEKNLFRPKKQTFDGDQREISLHVCKTPLQEVLFTANEIRRLVAQEGYRFQEIAVVTGDMQTFGIYVRYIFSLYQIPCFIDQKRAVLNNPAVEFVRAAMHVVSDGFSYPSMMRFLRSDYSDIEQSDCDCLENYILARGIRGRKRWLEPWIAQTKAVDAAKLQRLNELRTLIMQQLEPFGEIFRKKSATVREKSAALFQLMTDCQLQQKIKMMEQAFTESKQLDLAKEYAQIYEAMLHILDQIVELLGDEKLSPQEYEKLLEAGFMEQKIGIIPPGTDEVTFGDIERSRLNEIRALFFLGVNDGIIPGSNKNAGILSELERDLLEQQGAELAPGAREQYFNQKFYLYLNLTKPQQYLYITFSKMNVQGKAMNASYLIEEILSIFPSCPIKDEEEAQKTPEALYAPQSAWDYVVVNLPTAHAMPQRERQRYYALYHYFERQREKQLCQLRQAFRLKRTYDSIDRAVARVLYGDALEGSVTRLEQFAQCAYAHFLKYGLALREREEAGFAGIDFGNVMHGVLERYAAALKERGLTWNEIDNESADQLLDDCLDAAITEYGNQALYFTARDAYQVTRMRRIAKRTVWALGKQFQAGLFLPQEAEVAFHSVQELSGLPDGLATMRLRGRIDRIDTYEQDDEIYVKIVDYKTGQQKFKLLNVYHGVTLQLIMYLEEALELEKNKPKNQGKKVFPAAVLYYHIDDPVIEKSGVGEEKQDEEKRMLKALKTDGVISDAPPVLQAFDRNLGDACGKYSSDVVPVTVNKNGALAKNSKTMSQEELLLLTRYVKHKAQRMGEQILQGTIDASPIVQEKQNACAYCDYHSVCHFNENAAGFVKKELEELDETEVILKMKEQMQEGGKEHGSSMDAPAGTGD